MSPLSWKRRSLFAIAAAAAWPASAACEGPLKVLLNPLGHMTRLGDRGPSGSLPSLTQELARRTGCELRIEVLPRARLLKVFSESTGGGLMIGTENPSTAPLALFEPLARIRLSLIVERRRAAEAPSSLSELEHRSGWQGLFVRGASSSEKVLAFVERMEASRRLLQVRDWATVLRMLLIGRADFSLFTPSLLHGEVALMGERDGQRLQAISLPDLPSYEVGMLISRQLPPAVQRTLRQELRAMARDGSVRRLILREHPAALVEQDFQFLGS